MEKFRVLRADEIDCRISMVKANGVSLLLYKDARCDMNILDETVGPLNWQRSHSRDNANCTVSIWDDERKQWVSKEDTGKESYTEAEKGLASDSFKRACFNWGIGRELYTAPFIWIPADKCNIRKSGRKDSKGNDIQTCADRFSVEAISYNSKRSISSLVIRNDTMKVEAFSFGKKASGAKTEQSSSAKNLEDAELKRQMEKYMAEKGMEAQQGGANRVTEAMVNTIRAEQKRTGVSDKVILSRLHSKARSIEEMTVEEFKQVMKIFEVTKDLKREASDEHK